MAHQLLPPGKVSQQFWFLYSFKASFESAALRNRQIAVQTGKTRSAAYGY